MSDLGLLSLALGSSWSSGINLYLTVSILGICDRLGYLELPAGLDVLSHPLVIAVAVIMFLIEFCADKVPYVDSTWDSVHTFIRPIGGLIIGILAFNEAGPHIQVAAGLLGGTLALEAHSAKATTRAAINTSPEPVSNITASVAEDATVAGLMYLIIQHPLIAFFVVVALVVLSAIVIRFLFRFIARIFGFGKSKPASSVQQGSQ